jgi:hypothetical protein
MWFVPGGNAPEPWENTEGDDASPILLTHSPSYSDDDVYDQNSLSHIDPDEHAAQYNGAGKLVGDSNTNDSPSNSDPYIPMECKTPNESEEVSQEEL